MRADISATEPDWSREQLRPGEWNPGKRLLATIRAYQGAAGPFAWLVRGWAVRGHRRWSAISGADIPLNAQLGGGLVLLHSNGIVIHPAAIIGPNCMLMQQVTIGAGEKGAPVIGGRVDIGAGAKVLGAVTIGDQAQIGANAVVLSDVPAGTTAVGVPARIVRT